MLQECRALDTKTLKQMLTEMRTCLGKIERGEFRFESRAAGMKDPSATVSWVEDLKRWINELEKAISERDASTLHLKPLR